MVDLIRYDLDFLFGVKSCSGLITYDDQC